MKDCKYSLEIMKKELESLYICPEIRYAFESSIESLNKQIPKLVSELNGDGGNCPICHMHNLDVFRYCNGCGQRLEWN